MKKVVLFDFHNTLVTCDAWLDLEIRTLPVRVMEWLAERGTLGPGDVGRADEAEILFRELRQSVRESGQEISAVEGTRRVLVQLGCRLSAGVIEEAVSAVEYSLLPLVNIVPGAGEAVEQLHDRGYLLGVVSSAGYPPFVELALEMLGLRPFFSEVVTSAAEGLYKSDPELFRRAARKLGASPSETVHVGDHALYDVRAAKAAGLSAVWFAPRATGDVAKTGGEQWERATRGGDEADAVITTMSDLPSAIDRLG